MKIKHQIKKLYGELTPLYKTEVLSELLAEKELEGIVLSEAEQSVRQKRIKKPCPYCSSTKVHKRGMQNGNQVYQCMDCKKELQRNYWYSLISNTNKRKMANVFRFYGKRFSNQKDCREIGYKYSN